MTDSFVTPWTIACSSAHGIFQARILEWVVIFFSRGSSWPRDWTCVSCITGRFFTAEPPGKPTMWNSRVDESQVRIKFAGRNINNFRYADDTTPMAESVEEQKSILMRMKEWKSWLETQHWKKQNVVSDPITSWWVERERMEVVTDFIFLGSKTTAVAAAMKLKNTCSLEEKLWPT